HRRAAGGLAPECRGGAEGPLSRGRRVRGARDRDPVLSHPAGRDARLLLPHRHPDLVDASRRSAAGAALRTARSTERDPAGRPRDRARRRCLTYGSRRGGEAGRALRAACIIAAPACSPAAPIVVSPAPARLPPPGPF